MRQKQLLVGSGPYIKEWWGIHSGAFKYVNCINTSIEVVGMNHHRWYVSEDYFYHHDWSMPGMLKRSGQKFVALKMTTSWIKKPHFYDCPWNGTMLVNCIYDILNRATLDETPTELSLVGCDLDYSGDKTHFYEGGTNDPRRIPDDILIGHLSKVKRDFSPMHEIFTLGPTPSILPFPQGDPELVWNPGS